MSASLNNATLLNAASLNSASLITNVSILTSSSSSAANNSSGGVPGVAAPHIIDAGVVNTTDFGSSPLHIGDSSSLHIGDSSRTLHVGDSSLHVGGGGVNALMVATSGPAFTASVDLRPTSLSPRKGETGSTT